MGKHIELKSADDVCGDAYREFCFEAMTDAMSDVTIEAILIQFMRCNAFIVVCRLPLG